MILKYKSQQKQNDFSKSSQKSDNNLSAHKLTASPTFPHTAPVDANHRQTAKFWDCYTHIWRQHRQHDAGGFFIPVGYASGFMPGMRGLQNGINRNKRIAYQIGVNSTRQLLPNVKTESGELAMTAISTMGNTARNPLAYLPHVPFAPAHPKRKTPDTLVFKKSRTGLIAYRYASPVAWIVEGHHEGKVGNELVHIRFVDVAYHRKTRYGINLETFDCDTLEQAQNALRAIFERADVAGGFSDELGCAASTNGGAA